MWVKLAHILLIIIWITLQKRIDKMNIKMDIISGYKNSVNTSQINNSRGVNLATNQGDHQQPAVSNQHEDIKYT